MAEHQEIVRVSDPGEKSSRFKQLCDELLEDLQRERDELRVRLHLARKEVQDDVDALDDRMEDLKARARTAGTEAGQALDDIEGATRQLWKEIKDGFERVRRSLVE